MKKNENGFSAVEVLFAIVLIAMIVGIGWYVIKTRNEANKSSNNTQSTSQTPSKPTSQKPVDKTPQVVAEINALINKGEYSKLDTYMTDKVLVVRQSTDGNGDLSKADAAKSISTYLTKSSASLGANLPWDFTGHTESRDKISKSRIISNYAGLGNIGISANNWVVAYRLNNDLKIDLFYLSISADIIE